MQARFRQPVYDGDDGRRRAGEADGDAALDLRDRSRAGGAPPARRARRRRRRRAGRRRGWPPVPRTTAARRRRPRCCAPAPCSARCGRASTPRHAGRTSPTSGRSCRSTRDAGIAHPGWLLRFANRILSGNVVLGPWIHVGSRRAPPRPGRRRRQGRGAGAPVPTSSSARATASSASTSAIVADEQLVATVDHTAIYQPRQVAAAG